MVICIVQLICIEAVLASVQKHLFHIKHLKVPFLFIRKDNIVTFFFFLMKGLEKG